MFTLAWVNILGNPAQGGRRIEMSMVIKTVNISVVVGFDADTQDRVMKEASQVNMSDRQRSELQNKLDRGARVTLFNTSETLVDSGGDAAYEKAARPTFVRI